MPVEHRLPQPAGEVVSIAGWEPDVDFPFGPQGAKPKRIVVCPSPTPHPYLIGGHRYLFKEPTGSKAQQIWAEVIAYEIARGLDVSVPPAFVAYDPYQDRPGVLVEFFYGHHWDEAIRFVHAIERFQGLGILVNEARGSLRDNILLTRAHKIVGSRRWWARTLAFDAMIGNTDRHSENWGFLIAQGALDEPRYTMAPAFDNGTSLGYLVREADLAKFLRPERYAEFIARGRHHFGWLSGNTEDAGHADLCRRLKQVFPTTVETMRQTVQVADSRIEEIMQWCATFEFPVAFSQARAEFVAAQLKTRRGAIKAAIGA